MTELLTVLLAETAQTRPECPAVEHEDARFTYHELADVAARLASKLVSGGVCVGDRVGVLAPKSLQTVASLYGAMWAGGGYVPLDAGAPTDRLVYMIRNCGMKALCVGVHQARTLLPHLDDLPLSQVILLDADEPPEELSVGSPVPVIGWRQATESSPLAAPVAVGSDDLAYILYTSGSTGDPKGVMISHGNAMAFVRWAHETIGVAEDDRLSSHAPFHFDLSIFDLYVACRAGATVVLIPEEVAVFPVTLADWIETKQITTWYSVPSALVRLMQGGRLDRYEYGSLRRMLFAGEVFAPKYLRDWMEKLPKAKWFNLYGPTETNVCTYLEVTETPENDTPVSIGKAASGAVICLRNEANQKITETGSQGEIWVQGPSVALGYFGDDEKTAERFVFDRGEEDSRARVYRTGDLASWDEHGNLVFQGRRDHMVKSRGYRIELGEIEAVSLAHPAVLEACVITIPDEQIGVSLLACLALHEGAELDRAAFEQHLSKRLPRYMLPQEVKYFDVLPKTSTGKVDRQALAAYGVVS